MNRGDRRQAFIVADDLTGAADTAMQLAPAGAPARIVLWDPGDADRNRLIADGAGVLSIDTASRGLPGEAARERIAGLLRRLTISGGTICYKKLDSGLRGNVAAEIAAIFDAHPDAVVVVAPAFPTVGRTTVGGVQHADGRPVTLHPTGRDLLSPVSTAHIPTLLKSAVSAPIASVPIVEVRRGRQFLASRLRSLEVQGFRVLVVDAETDQDLDTLARSLVEAGLDRFVAGSGGLAGALKRAGVGRAGSAGDSQAGLDGMHGRSPEAGAGTGAAAIAVVYAGAAARKAAFRLSGPGVIASASRHPVARAQLRAAGSVERAAATLQLEPLRQGGAAAQGEEERLVDLIAKALAQGRDVVLGVEPDSTTGGDPALSLEFSARINRAVGRILSRSLAAGASWMFLVGGDTARSFCDAVGARSLSLVTDASAPDGVSIAQIAFGAFAGFPIAMKSGGFGGEELINTLVHLWRKD